MEILKITKRITRIKVCTYGVDNKGYPTYRGSEIYQNANPEGFDIPEDIVSFTVSENDTIEDVNGRIYNGDNKIASVYMGSSMAIEDAIREYPDNSSLLFAYKEGVKRAAIRADGHVSPMYDNSITFEEYCDQYKESKQLQTQQHRKVKNSSKYPLY